MCENFLIFKLLKLLLWRSFGCVKLLLVKTLAILLWRSDVAGKVIPLNHRIRTSVERQLIIVLFYRKYTPCLCVCACKPLNTRAAHTE